MKTAHVILPPPQRVHLPHLLYSCWPQPYEPKLYSLSPFCHHLSSPVASSSVPPDGVDVTDHQIAGPSSSGQEPSGPKPSGFALDSSGVIRSELSSPSRHER